MLSLKPGAKLLGMRPEIFFGLVVLERIFSSYGYDTVVTEATGGTHKDGSLHYKGLALDIRSKHIPDKDTKFSILEDAKELLTRDFDIILEAFGTESEHYHIEYDPK